jgi:hypothetical protein
LNILDATHAEIVEVYQGLPRVRIPYPSTQLASIVVRVHVQLPAFCCALRSTSSPLPMCLMVRSSANNILVPTDYVPWREGFDSERPLPIQSLRETCPAFLGTRPLAHGPRCGLPRQTFCNRSAMRMSTTLMVGALAETTWKKSCGRQGLIDFPTKSSVSTGSSARTLSLF